ncbi:MAG: hypothetical protein E6I91_00015 [Chloroflexi bacterium]|nr:MAG: hypothetical protein E6I91_00015 [Chloroflexota bacterium]
MMNEGNPAEEEQGKRTSLEERLTAFYGPELPEQPLPPSSWQVLRSQLRARRSPRFRFMRRWHVRRTLGGGRVPAFVQAAFAHMMYEARLPFSASMLHCTIRPHTRVPLVHVSLLRRQHIRLQLPSPIEETIESSMLDVLLATGLARFLSMRRPAYMLPHLLLFCIIPFACIALILLRFAGFALPVLLIAIGLCIVLSLGALFLLDRQRRAMAIRADNLMVQWLGRGRACQGLHALADRNRAPSRRRLGELSLTERIGRVCGTQVLLEQERLTLVK